MIKAKMAIPMIDLRSGRLRLMYSLAFIFLPSWVEEHIKPYFLSLTGQITDVNKTQKLAFQLPVGLGEGGGSVGGGDVFVLEGARVGREVSVGSGVSVSVGTGVGVLDGVKEGVIVAVNVGVKVGKRVGMIGSGVLVNSGIGV